MSLSPRQVSLEEWAAALQPGTPPLPWTGSQGQTIASFMLVPIPECSIGTTVVFMDADGHRVDVRNDGPLYRTAVALKPAVGTVVQIPDVVQAR